MLRTVPLALLALSCAAPGGAEDPAAEATGVVRLFDGATLEGWTADLADDAPASAAWRVEDGLLRCAGEPVGVLRTTGDFADYELVVEYRWPAEPANSGILLHCSTPRNLGPWPRSVEVQLKHGRAGDFYLMGDDVGIEVDDAETRARGRSRARYEAGEVEVPPGEWNTIRVRAEGGDVTTVLNGVLVNEGRGATETRGAIALQSEGGPIDFRRVDLVPLR